MTQSFDISKIVKEYGVKNIRVFGNASLFAFKSTGIDFEPILQENEVRTEFIIKEGIYKITDKYKIELSPLDKEMFDIKFFYLSDFNNLVKEGNYSVYVLTGDGYHPIHVVMRDVETI